jgi:hypothetical protein
MKMLNYSIPFILLLLSCRHYQPSRLKMGKLDTAGVNAIIREGVVLKMDTPARKDFYYVSDYKDTIDGSLTRILRDSLKNVVGINQTRNGTKIFVAEYFTNGQQRGDIPINEEGNMTGMATYYYENGHIKSTGRLEDGIKVGKWENYDETGNLEENPAIDSTVSQSLPPDSSLGSEVWTVYSKKGVIYSIKRLLKVDAGYLLLSYDIDASKPEQATQTLNSRQASKTALDVKTFLDNGYDWQPFKETPLLFVQIEGKAFKDDMAELRMRQEIEPNLKDTLESNGFGTWVAGDFGAGGINMLFEVNNVERAIPVIHQVLLHYKLAGHAVIGRRIYTSANDWYYEVLYPIGFTGDFLTM